MIPGRFVPLAEDDKEPFDTEKSILPIGNYTEPLGHFDELTSECPHCNKLLTVRAILTK